MTPTDMQAKLERAARVLARYDEANRRDGMTAAGAEHAEALADALHFILGPASPRP